MEKKPIINQHKKILHTDLNQSFSRVEHLKNLSIDFNQRKMFDTDFPKRNTPIYLGKKITNIYALVSSLKNSVNIERKGINYTQKKIDRINKTENHAKINSFNISKEEQNLSYLKSENKNSKMANFDLSKVIPIIKKYN